MNFNDLKHIANVYEKIIQKSGKSKNTGRECGQIRFKIKVEL
jgi:hypothetical protein